MNNNLLDKIFSLTNVKHLLNSVHDGIIITDKNRKVIFINRKAANLLQNKEDDVIGLYCRDVTHSTKCQTDECPHVTTLKTGKPIIDYNMIYMGSNNKAVKAKTNWFAIRDDKNKIIAGFEIFHDITEIEDLQEQLNEKNSFQNIIGKNIKMQEIFELVKEVAPTSATILIQGETGTGKELVGNAIHKFSQRKNQPFVKVNCSIFADSLLESELFGHVKGAFTGALFDKKGRFELADKGTIFLDEIGELSLSTQVKLLRILQNNEFEKVGGTKTVKTDIRVVTATNKDLVEAIQEGSFREDLYYRLHVVPIFLPPLRERKDDIPLLVNHFINLFNKKNPEKSMERMDDEVLEFLMDYDFPGNVRELENIIEHGCVRARGPVILLDNLPQSLLSNNKFFIGKSLKSSNPLDTLEKEVVLATLKNVNWQYLKAAEKLDISRTSLWRKIKKYSITKP